MFELSLTAEDIVVLAGQDFVMGPGTKYSSTTAPWELQFDVKERFRRLATAVTKSSGCGARLVTNASVNEQLSAARIATRFADQERVLGAGEKKEYLISQTRTGFAFMEEARPIYAFAGPVSRSPGDLCPVH